MGNLSNIGRIFYGLAIAETGFQTMYYSDFPYWLLPPKHSWIPGLVLLAYISGIMLVLAGACIVFEKKPGLFLSCQEECFYPYFVFAISRMNSWLAQGIHIWWNGRIHWKNWHLPAGHLLLPAAFQKKMKTLYQVFEEANTLRGYFFFHTVDQFRYGSFSICKGCIRICSIMGALPFVLGLSYWHSTNWFGPCDYFENQDQTNCCSFGDNDFHLVYCSPHPQGDRFPCRLYGKWSDQRIYSACL